MEDNWDQIGRRLRDARESAGLEVADVVFRTRIPRTIVEALEAEEFAVFSSPTYAKSFLRQYSEYLEVDATPWLTALEPTYYAGMDVLGPVLDTRGELPKREPEPEPREGGGFLPAVLLVVLTGGLIYGAIEGYRMLEEKFGKEHHQVKEEAPAPPLPPEPVEILKPQDGEPAPPATFPVMVERKDHDPHSAIHHDPEQPLPPPRAIIVRD